MSHIKLERPISALFVAAGIALGGYFISHAIMNFKASDRVVTVKGLAEKIVTANRAIWQLQFKYADDHLGDLYQGITKAQSTVRQFLLAQGFAAENITLQPLSVTDNQTNSYNSNQKAKRYVASAGIILSSGKVDKVRDAVQLTGALVKQGIILDQSSVRYLFTKLNEIKPGMLNQATANAKVAAESFATNSHSDLGDIRSARQGLFSLSDPLGGYDAKQHIQQKVRVVTTVQYFLND